jgi:hypothetical protein
LLAIAVCSLVVGQCADATGALAAGGQVLAMPFAAVALGVLQPLDVLLDLPAQGALHRVVGVDLGGDRGQLLVVKRVRPALAVDAALGQDVVGHLRSDAVDVAEREADLLLLGDVDAGDAGHGAFLVGWSGSVGRRAAGVSPAAASGAGSSC